MTCVLCHLGKPRTTKPATQSEYGILRNRMIQSPWVALEDEDFIKKVTVEGRPFYGALMHGRDLIELQSEVAVWRTQSLVALDFDACDISSKDMVQIFVEQNLSPWVGYRTFSNDPVGKGGESYRLLWKVDIDLNLTYGECSRALKRMRSLSKERSDKFANNPTRLWQGTNSGCFLHNPESKKVNLRSV
jgi:hypothetical protein